MLEMLSKCKWRDLWVGKFQRFELFIEKNYMGVNYMILLSRKTEYKAEMSPVLWEI